MWLPIIVQKLMQGNRTSDEKDQGDEGEDNKDNQGDTLQDGQPPMPTGGFIPSYVLTAIDRVDKGEDITDNE